MSERHNNSGPSYDPGARKWNTLAHTEVSEDSKTPAYTQAELQRILKGASLDAAIKQPDRRKLFGLKAE